MCKTCHDITGSGGPQTRLKGIICSYQVSADLPDFTSSLIIPYSHLFSVLGGWWWRGCGQLAAMLLLLVAAVTRGHLCHPALYLLQPLQDGHPKLIICTKKQAEWDLLLCVKLCGFHDFISLLRGASLQTSRCSVSIKCVKSFSRAHISRLVTRIP